jgi:hypothetical protein
VEEASAASAVAVSVVAEPEEAGSPQLSAILIYCISS